MSVFDPKDVTNIITPSSKEDEIKIALDVLYDFPLNNKRGEAKERFKERCHGASSDDVAKLMGPMPDLPSPPRTRAAAAARALVLSGNQDVNEGGAEEDNVEASGEDVETEDDEAKEESQQTDDNLCKRVAALQPFQDVSTAYNEILYTILYSCCV